MKVNRVFLDSIKDCKIEKLEIEEKVNEHSFAKISGIIPGDKVQNCMNLAKSNTYISVKGITDNGKIETMFVGLVYDLKIQADANVNTLEITLVSGTILMDGNENTKTFQDVSMNYSAIYKNIESAQSASSLMLCNDKAIEKMIVQYNETNWQFAKRLASNLNTCIYPYVLQSGVKYCIGVGDNRKVNFINNVQVHIKQSIDKYMVDEQIDNINSINDCISYEFESREYFPIGSKVAIDKTRDNLFVYELQTKLVKSEVITSYILKGKNGFKRPRKCNNRIIGASLGGTIKSVSKDKVKVNIDADAESLNSQCGSKEFLYSTVYSSPDGTGWYCMPENGDKVRLYFPTQREEDGYVISSVHLDVNSSPSSQSSGSNGGNSGQIAPRSNPDYKSISNKQKKEIIFTPDKLIVTNNKGLSIVLDDEEGITIQSDKGIYLKAKDTIQLQSEKDFYASAEEKFEINRDNKSITMENDNITMKGATLKLQEG